MDATLGLRIDGGGQVRLAPVKWLWSPGPPSECVRSHTTTTKPYKATQKSVVAGHIVLYPVAYFVNDHKERGDYMS
jgi:hypothetical protein